jgi:glyoxylase-like metal-dependent hydrolase (beta-lactamase superfamily II)
MGKAKLIHERVYQIGGSSISDGSDCSIYMIVTDNNDLILIDAGTGPSFPRLLRIIEKAGFEPKFIRLLVLTHGHIDHIGGAPDFIDFCKCKVVAHEGDLDAIEGRNMKKTAAEWYGVDFQPVKVDDVIKGEEETRTLGDIELHFLHTPGHTPGSMVVYVDIEGKRVLFGQDIHGPFDPAFDSDIGDWRKSMKKLLALDADILCEGHFGVYKGKDRVKNFINGYLESVGGRY